MASAAPELFNLAQEVLFTAKLDNQKRIVEMLKVTSTTFKRCVRTALRSPAIYVYPTHTHILYYFCVSYPLHDLK